MALARRAGECEVIQELVTAATSSAEPEEQSDVAKTGIRLQYDGPLVHQSVLLCLQADWRLDSELLGVSTSGGSRPPERGGLQLFHSIVEPRKARSYNYFCY